MATCLTLIRCPRTCGLPPQYPGRTPIYSPTTGKVVGSSCGAVVSVTVGSMTAIVPQDQLLGTANPRRVAGVGAGAAGDSPGGRSTIGASIAGAIADPSHPTQDRLPAPVT